MKRLTEAKKIIRISTTTNLSLSFIKILSGILGNSTLLLADGVDSLSDVFITFIAYIGVSISEKKEDENHQYGHEKYETVFAKIIAFTLVITAFSIMYMAYNNLAYHAEKIPTKLTLFVALFSIIIKLLLSRYVLNVARTMESIVFEADAKNYLNDALLSIVSLVGIYLASVGYTVIQPILTFLIGVLILKNAIFLFKESVDDLTDKAASDIVVNKIRDNVIKIDGVESIDDLKTRMHAKKIFVDIEIGIKKDVSFIIAHDISEIVHDRVEALDDRIKHCMVHINPVD